MSPGQAQVTARLQGNAMPATESGTASQQVTAKPLDKTAYLPAANYLCMHVSRSVPNFQASKMVYCRQPAARCASRSGGRCQAKQHQRQQVHQVWPAQGGQGQEAVRGNLQNLHLQVCNQACLCLLTALVHGPIFIKSFCKCMHTWGL